MTIQEVIQKAVEGGASVNFEQETVSGQSRFLLSSSFWQALGKSLGWGCICGEAFVNCTKHGTVYMAAWHKLVDHLAEGGTIESYFTNLK